ncbi:MAG: hypothetical protein ACLVJH_17815 [Faecalibacterium prausnitzii]
MWPCFTAGRYSPTERFRLNEQDPLALFERSRSYDLVLLEGFGDSGWAKIEVWFAARSARWAPRSSPWPSWAMCRALVLHWTITAALADWIENQMPSL